MLIPEEMVHERKRASYNVSQKEYYNEWVKSVEASYSYQIEVIKLTLKGLIKTLIKGANKMYTPTKIDLANDARNELNNLLNPYGIKVKTLVMNFNKPGEILVELTQDKVKKVSASAEMSLYQDELKRYVNEINELNSEMDDKNKDIIEYKNQISDVDKIINDKTNEVVELKNRLKEYEKALSDEVELSERRLFKINELIKKGIDDENKPMTPSQRNAKEIAGYYKMLIDNGITGEVVNELVVEYHDKLIRDMT